jgi:hypothetical protein
MGSKAPVRDNSYRFMPENLHDNLSEVGVGGVVGKHECLVFKTPIKLDPNVPFYVSLSRRLVELEAYIHKTEAWGCHWPEGKCQVTEGDQDED